MLHLRPSHARPAATTPVKPHVRGRFLYAGEQKLVLRGVTYGTFAEGADGTQFPPPAVVEQDFRAMSAAGVNAVRTYTPAPRWLLDLAAAHGLYVLAGLPWEGHLTFLDRRETARSIERRVREQVRGMAGHPALLAYSIGNEIPAGVTRWHGRQRTERFLERLYDAAKDEDPETLVTYVNFPTTEYLQLPFVDFDSFNVYLEDRPALEAYLARLHNLAGDKPLVMAEIGLDSRRNGEAVQAAALEWQLGSAFRSGCAGAFAFAWTDEWHRGGHDIDDWDFGLVGRDRRPKPALEAVTRAFARLHRDEEMDWPRVSVVVCSYNGERWLPGCLEALERVEYPDFEVIVVSDGSTDATAEIARAAGVTVVETDENHGLSHARNEGLAASTAEIVAYLDDDARPDPDWLRHLALSFARTEHVAIGGPNVPPPDTGPVADCIAHAPGGPVHVLVADDLAEHIPGCNTAVRREALAAIGGFDPRFRIAGDDVDVCWRLQEAGGTIGFSPGAMVWHHRRDTVKGYLRQQRNYGRAEALLEDKWPERYNRLGHLHWHGVIYGDARGRRHGRRSRIAYGTWGTQAFQSIYAPAPTLASSLTLMPESYAGAGALALLSALGALWAPLLVALPLLALYLGAMVGRAFSASHRHDHAYRSLPLARRARKRALTTALHLAQPAVRLAGRAGAGLHPWRRRTGHRPELPWPRVRQLWSERWLAEDAWVRSIATALRANRAFVRAGGTYDRWDLRVRGGAFGVARLLCVVEEHGAGRQQVRVRSWPVLSRAAVVLTAAFAGLAVLAVVDGAPVVAAVLGLVAVSVAGRAAYDCSVATGAVAEAVRAVQAEVEVLNATPQRDDRREDLARRIAQALESGDGEPILTTGHASLQRVGDAEEA